MRLELGPHYRVELTPDGYKVYDMKTITTVTLQDPPEWMKEAVALLLLIEHSAEVKGVGYRYNSTIFYLERRGAL